MPFFGVTEKRPRINIFKPGADMFPKQLTPCEGLRPCFDGGACTFAVEMCRYGKQGELLRNSVESYPMRDKILLVMKDMARVEQAAMGAVVRATMK